MDSKEAIELRKQAQEYIERNGIGKKKTIRYEFPKVNDAWCMDIKYIEADGERMYLFKIIDDTSRFDILSFITSTPTTDIAIELIKAARNVMGVTPKSIKTDRGTQFKDIFGLYLKSQGIHHIRSIPYFPKCNAKMERVFLDVENNVFKDAISSETRQKISQQVMIETLEHNYARPHQSLSGLTPSEIYFGIEDYVKDKIKKFCTSVKGACSKLKEKTFNLVPVEHFIPGSTCEMSVKVFE